MGVFVDPATGVISTGNADSSEVEGLVDTGWKVVTGASANDVCEIACI